MKNGIDTSFGGFTRRAVKVALLWLVSAFSLGQASAATLTARSIPELQSLINSAQAGDTVLLANGTYLNNTLTIGTSDITVAAATPGGVFLNGTNAITISGSRVTFSGFQFTAGSIPGFVITVTGSQNLLTQLNFKGYSAQKYIVIKAPSQYNQITYSNFENKPSSAPIGNLIHLEAHPSIPGYHKIRYSSFQNMPGSGGDNGNENIRLSNGAESTYIARFIVEFNYFSNTGMGDSEAISVKCRENVLRYNTFNRNPNAMMVFRNGNDNIAYGNFFIDSGGIRVKEANNIYIYNNYFERAGVGGTTNAVTYDYITGNLKNINFIHNTFVDSGLISLASGATLNTWANNILVKSSGNIFSGSATGITWTGNMYWGAPLGVAIPSAGMTSVNPLLALNADGYFGLTSISPAINAGSSSYPSIPDIANVDDDPRLQYDASGQIRDALKDVGSDEFAVGGATSRPLKLSDVGPAYLGGPGAVPPPDNAPSLNPVIAVSATRVDLSWINLATNATGIRILRCTGEACVPATSVATLAPAQTVYSDTSVVGGTRYGYVVEAFNTGGVKASGVAYITTPLPPPPAAPVLALGSPTRSSLTLSWTEDTSSVPVTGFDILRCTGVACVPSTVIVSLGSSARSYVNSGLSRRSTYTYQVRARNGSAGTLSNAASGSTN